MVEQAYWGELSKNSALPALPYDPREQDNPIHAENAEDPGEREGPGKQKRLDD